MAVPSREFFVRVRFSGCLYCRVCYFESLDVYTFTFKVRLSKKKYYWLLFFFSGGGGAKNTYLCYDDRHVPGKVCKFVSHSN